MKEKDKNISIKYLVLDNFKPKVKNGENHFPVYTQVVYKGKNTKFKTTIDGNPIYVSENRGLDDTAVTNLSVELKEYKNRINAIVDFESYLLQRRFTLTGLGRRLSFYNQSIEGLLIDFLEISGTNDYLQNKLTYKEYLEWESIKDLSKKIMYLHKISYDKNKIIYEGMPEELTFFPDTPFVIKNALVNLMEWGNYKKYFPENFTFYGWIFDGIQKKLLTERRVLKKKYPEYEDIIKTPKKIQDMIYELAGLERMVKMIDTMIPIMIRSQFIT